MSDKEVLLGILDRVTEHLLAQGQPATDDCDSCVYRAYRNGEVLKCAVGCLIQDEHYDPRFEGWQVCSLIVNDGRWEGIPKTQSPLLAKALNASGVPASNQVRGLLTRVQFVHDTMRPECWRTVLAEFRSRLQGGTL